MAASKVRVAWTAVVALVIWACANTADTTTSSSTQTTAISTTTSPTTITSPTTTTLPPTTTTAVPTTTTLPATTTSAAPRPAQVLRRGPSDRAVAALTFDAGSDTGFAAEILDTLAQYEVRASFGLTGRWVEMNPELTERIVTEGHVVINHTYSHPSFTGFSTGTAPLGADLRQEQVAKAETLITEATGLPAKPLFRPPYGDLDDDLLLQLGGWGYQWVVMWTVDSLGWDGLSSTQIVERCLSRAESGAIYLFHVGAASADHAALSTIIEGLRDGGWDLVTIPELIDG